NHISCLTALTMVLYDCCPQSCILYAGKYTHLLICPHCKQLWFKANGKPHCQFTYFLLIPHLQGFFQSIQMICLMDYHTSYQPTHGSITDVFNGTHYQGLMGEYVLVDGERLCHKHFSHHCDIALALSTDGYSLYKSKQ
ncbi:hypothetical protein EDD16DRAFT_1445240, partial [Pisolithus croceorrhizus]